MALCHSSTPIANRWNKAMDIEVQTLWTKNIVHKISTSVRLGIYLNI